MAKVDVLVNIPLVGTVQYVDWFAAKVVDGKQFGAQVRLKGSWNTAPNSVTPGEIYLPGPVMGLLLQDGLVEEMGSKEHNGVQVPQYKWLHRGQVQVLKAQEGKTTRTSVLPIEKVGQAPQPTAQPSMHVPAPVRQPAGQPVTSGDDPWADLGNTYAKSRNIARKAWGEAWEALDDVAKAAAVATIFIESGKRGLHVARKPFAPPPAKPSPVHAQAAALRDQFDASAGAEDEDEASLPF